MPRTARKLEREEAAGPKRPRAAPRLVRLEPRPGLERRAETEVEALPARYLGELPRPATLFLHVPGHDGLVAIASCCERADAEREGGLMVFDPVEWSAIVAAAESDRLWPADFRELCARKAARRGWVVDLDFALAGARAEGPRGWSVGRVLSRLGARLVHVDC